MEYAELARIAMAWEDMTDAVLDIKKLSLTDVQAILRETHAVLTVCCKDQFVPKGISKILLNMDGFLP